MDTARKIRDNFGAIWPAHVENLVRLLIHCREVFGGDLDMFMVMAVIGERTFSKRHADTGVDYERWRSGSSPPTKAEDINASSIAHFSGIARETVRRKLAALQSRGWVERDGQGNYVATIKASAELEPLTVVSIDYIARMHDAVAKS